MNNDNIYEQIEDAIHRIQMADNTQQEMNSIYTSIVELYQTEMANKLNPVGIIILKLNRHSLKPWWNENLTKL